ncbi:hypothetical protein J6590_037102 [Homalodisca vitripennis]|nr:hypothetical protein J6590_037102 [Homalodisca vitripennis]
MENTIVQTRPKNNGRLRSNGLKCEAMAVTALATSRRRESYVSDGACHLEVNDQCVHCQVWQLKTHIRRAHNEMYKCVYCNMNIRYRHTLKKHLMSKHRDKTEEWDSPGALKAMMERKPEKSLFHGKERNESGDPGSSSVKDILQTVTDSIMNEDTEAVMHVHIKAPEAARTYAQMYQYNTRHESDYCLPRHRLTATEKSPSYTGAKMWTNFLKT